MRRISAHNSAKLVCVSPCVRRPSKAVTFFTCDISWPFNCISDGLLAATLALSVGREDTPTFFCLRDGRVQLTKGSASLLIHRKKPRSLRWGPKMALLLKLARASFRQEHKAKRRVLTQNSICLMIIMLHFAGNSVRFAATFNNNSNAESTCLDLRSKGAFLTSNSSDDIASRLPGE